MEQGHFDREAESQPIGRDPVVRRLLIQKGLGHFGITEASANSMRLLQGAGSLFERTAQRFGPRDNQIREIQGG